MTIITNTIIIIVKMKLDNRSRDNSVRNGIGNQEYEIEGMENQDQCY